MRNETEAVADLIGLPPYSFVAFGLVVGWPNPARPSSVRPRPPQDMILHHNCYDATKYEPAIETYEAAFLKFRAEFGLQGKTWKDAVRATSRSLDYMAGREELRDTVTRRGFKLL